MQRRRRGGLLAWRVTTAKGLVAVVGGALTIMLVTTASAQAFVFHKYLSTPHITELPASSGAPLPGPVTELDSMTVDNGHLWIAEHMAGTSNYRIDEFDAETGAFMAQIFHGTTEYREGIAVGHSTGTPQIYVGDKTGVGVLSESGAVLKEWTGFSKVQDVAADNYTSGSDPASGFVYVLDGSTLDVFKPEAAGERKAVTLVKPFTVSGAERLAVDQGNGDVVVSTGTAIKVYRPTEPSAGTHEYEYELLTTITGTPARNTFSSHGSHTSIAVDGRRDEIYLAEPCFTECILPASSVIYEFSLPTGAYVGRTDGEGIPEGTLGQPGPTSVAVDPASHHLFVGIYHNDEGGEAVDAFGPDIVVPDVETTPATGVKPTGEGAIDATLNGTVNPDKEGTANCVFVWGISEAALEGREHEAKCEATVAEGESSAPVSAQLSGLEPDVTYYFRLQATNKNGTNPGEAWQDKSFTTPGPGLHGESVSEVFAEAATLEATINPHGAPTSYFFEYGPSGAYGYTTPSTSIGSGEGDVEVSRQVSEHLSAHTPYHYRVVVESKLEVGGETRSYVFDGPDQTFTTQRRGEGLQLLDGRQWELVSPPDKHGAAVLGIESIQPGVAQAAANGDAFTYVTFNPTESGAQGNGLGVQVLAQRGPGRWSSRDIATPNVESTGANLQGREYRFFSDDLSLGVVERFAPFAPLTFCAATGCVPESSPAATEKTVYLRHDHTCEVSIATCYEPLVTAATECSDVPAGTQFGEHLKFEGAAGDGRHVVLRATVALTEEPFEAGREPSLSTHAAALYEWSASKSCGQRLQLVSVLPGGQGISNAQLGEENVGQNARHAISDDGTRVFWSEHIAPGHLYMTDLVKKETVELGSGPARFQTANADGSVAFYIEGGELYACRIRDEAEKLACKTSDLTLGKGGRVGKLIPGASENGAYVYFVTSALVNSAPNASGETAKAKEANLYVDHYDSKTESWESPQLVAVLGTDDARDWAGEAGESVGANPFPYLEFTTSRVSSDGRWLAFMSNRSLTGYDNEDVTSKTLGVKRDEEVYLYHAAAYASEEGDLVCASCNPTGARPRGRESEGNGGTLRFDDVLEPPGWFSGIVPGYVRYGGQEAIHQPRYLSNGGRLFFDSTEALAPQDVNGQIDVYEYEAPIGAETAASDTCTTSSSTYSERDGGCIALISSGESQEESAFIDASENGNDVFFETSSQLVGEDYDTAYDVYDAHVCTSEAPCFPEPAVTPLPCATTEGCREAPAQQPSVFGPPSSAMFSGSGDVLPGSKLAVKPKRLTRAQKLSRALSSCRKQYRKSKQRRARCERQAKKRYGARKSRASTMRKASASKRGGKR